MMEFLIFVVCVVFLTLLSGACLLTGYNIGVRDTERRWSDAVARADYARKANHYGVGA